MSFRELRGRTHVHRSQRLRAVAYGRLRRYGRHIARSHLFTMVRALRIVAASSCWLALFEVGAHGFQIRHLNTDTSNARSSKGSPSLTSSPTHATLADHELPLLTEQSERTRTQSSPAALPQETVEREPRRTEKMTAFGAEAFGHPVLLWLCLFAAVIFEIAGGLFAKLCRDFRNRKATV